MALYNNDPVKTCEIVNLRYNDLQPDTLTWDVNPLSAVTAIKKYRLRFTKVGSSDITEQESLTTTYILNNIDDGMWTVQVTPVGEYSVGTPASVSFTIRTLQDKVDIFTVDAKLHSGSTRADAKYDITAEDEHDPQIYASLSEVPDNIGYGFKIVKPDETEELRDNVNSIANYVLDAEGYHWESPEVTLTFRTGNFGLDYIYLTAAPDYEYPYCAYVSIDRENTYPLVLTNYNVIDSCKYTYTLPGASTESTAYTPINDGDAAINPIQYAGPETQIQVTIWPALENTQSIGQHSVTVTVTTMNSGE